MFQLTAMEWNNLKSQIVASNLKVAQIKGVTPNWSQIVTASQADSTMRLQIVTASKRNIRHRPHAFTEHGAIMAATVLNSPEAVAMSVFVVRAFMQMREQLAANAAILKRLAEIDKTLLEHDSALRTDLDEACNRCSRRRPNRRNGASVLTPITCEIFNHGSHGSHG